jgi:chromosome partitioning protein
MSCFIAIANEKGGVAKTTSTWSLGAALVEAGKQVLLVDLDPQANLSLAMGIENPPLSIANILLESAQPLKVILNTGILGLDIIPSNSEMRSAERFLPIRKNYENSLRKSLRDDTNKFSQNGTGSYDYVFLDCPPYLGAVTHTALMAADLLIMPTQPEYFSIHALGNMMSFVRRVRSENNPYLTYRILITLFDGRNRNHRTLTEQLRTTFKDGVLETAISIDTKLRECPIAGLPIVYYAPNSRAAIQYRALAQEIIQYVEETAKPAA